LAASSRAKTKSEEADEYTFNQTLEWIKLTAEERQQQQKEWINKQLDIYSKQYDMEFTMAEREKWCRYWPGVSHNNNVFALICHYIYRNNHELIKKS